MAKAKARPGEIMVELDDDHNSCLIEFAPLSKSYRGRWKREGMHTGATSQKSRVCELELAGQAIALNVQEKRGRIVDLASDEECEEALQNLSDAIKVRSAFHKECRAHPEETHKLGKQDVCNWWHWMKRLVDGGMAKLIAGRFEKQPEGDPKVDYCTRDPDTPKTIGDYERWAEGDWPPERGERRTA